MQDKPLWLRAVVITLTLAGFAAWVAALVWSKANPGSAWSWVLWLAVVICYVVLTIQKLRARSTPVDVSLYWHVNYLVTGLALTIAGALGQIPAENLITRAGLVLVTVVGIVVLIAGFRDLARWLPSEDSVDGDKSSHPEPDDSGAHAPG